MTSSTTAASRLIIPLVLAAIAATASFSTFHVVHASTTSHWTSGTSGTHTAGSHSLNPGHIWLAIGADHTSPITSGGRYHDLCLGVPCAPNGGDYAMDIGNPDPSNVGQLNWPSKLYVNYAGWGADPNPAVNNNMSISISAKMVAQSGSGDCQLQKFDIRVSYWGTNGTFYSNLVMGELWVMHLDAWVYGLNAQVSANASMPNPYGTGTVSYINGIQIGQLYDGPFSMSCNTGRHSHLEFLSNHAWGYQEEWHSCLGPDYYTNPTHSHTTGCSPSNGYNTTDSVGVGAAVSFLGGGTTSYFINDNQYAGDH